MSGASPETGRGTAQWQSEETEVELAGGNGTDERRMRRAVEGQGRAGWVL